MLAVNRIHQMDAIEGMRKLDAESVDLIVTDPPYNIASKNRKTIRHGELVTTEQAFGSWDTLHPFDHDVLIMTVLSESYRVLKPGGALYMFLAAQDSGHFIRKAVERGFTYRSQIAMAKTNPLPSFYKNAWRTSYDLCMYLTKGKIRTFNFLEQCEMVNVFRYAITSKATTHPTEKPLELIERFIRVSSKPGDLVLDPFMGSGTTAVAAKKLGRRFVGFEREKEYVQMARKRLGAKRTD